jgi:putative transcriptional regulator
MPRFSLEDIQSAEPADPARMAGTTDAEIALQIAGDPDTAPDLGDAPLAEFQARRWYPDVRGLRKRLALTQEQFASRFGVNIGTLRDWENHRREPEGPAQTLLKVIDHNPDAVRLALALAGR